MVVTKSGHILMKRNILKILTLLTLVPPLAGCIEETNGVSTDSVSSYEFDALEKRVTDLQASVYINRFELNKLKSLEGTIELTPATKDYAISQTQHGQLYFSLQDVKKYADGHKIILQVGNPNAATFKDVVLNIRYNYSPANAENWDAWKASIKETTYTLKGNLTPGTWTPYEIVLSPSKEEETGWIEITPTLNTVVLTIVPIRK